MRKRNCPFLIRLSEDEMIKLNEQVRKTGLSREAYIRKLLRGVQPIERPSADYFEVLRNLRQINVNLNQIAAKAHSLGFVDEPEYWRTVDKLQQVIGEIKQKTVGQ